MVPYTATLLSGSGQALAAPFSFEATENPHLLMDVLKVRMQEDEAPLLDAFRTATAR